MTTYLYCVLPEAVRDVTPPAGVRSIATPVGVAWVRASSVDGPDDAPNARDQQAVLLAALGTGHTPVPARAGTHFDSDAALVAALGDSAPTWRAALDRVRGRVEMLVFVVEPGPDLRDEGGAPPPPPYHRAGDATSPNERTPGDENAEPPPAPRSGRAYLEQLRQRLATVDAATEHADAWRRSLREALGGLAEDDAVVTHPSGRGVLVSHLVPRGRVVDYRAVVEAWRAAAGAPRAVVLGPWAPFSFVETRGA